MAAWAAGAAGAGGMRHLAACMQYLCQENAFPLFTGVSLPDSIHTFL